MDFPQLPTYSFEVITVNRKGEIIEKCPHQASYFRENLGDGVSLDMVYIPGGNFIMGAPVGERGSSNRERPEHQVTLQPFFMGKYAITQAQWRVVAALPKLHRDLDLDPSKFKGANRPVERVNWRDAVEFCARLSVATGRQYVLPSEAQWEYACRAGTTTPFHFGETITAKIANYKGSKISASRTYADEPKGEHPGETTPVGNFPPNSFGLYDMHGNVWEWCADPGSLHSNYEGAPKNGQVWDEDCPDTCYENYVQHLHILNNRLSCVIRGGSWNVIPRYCRSAFRIDSDLSYANGGKGFRIARSALMTP